MLIFASNMRYICRLLKPSRTVVMLKLACVFVILLVAVACGGGNSSTTSPSPTPTPPTPPTATTFSLSGQVTDSTTGTGISGATVRIIDGPNAGKSATTDGSGHFSFTGLQPSGFTVIASANNYLSQSTGVILTSNQTTALRLSPPVVLSGRVTDSTTSAPIAGATVSINGRYRSTTDSVGNYSDTGFLDAGINLNYTYVSANSYENDFRYIRGTTQNVHLYRIQRVTAGDSTVVTIAPDDTLCVNNVQDTPGLGQDYVCRSVRIVAPRDGVITLEALSTQGGARPPLEVETVGVSPCCSERLGNPTSIQVTAGTEVVAHVEMVSGSTSQTFTLNTSMEVLR
jgi:Carboxypeptidase regulatory-like domain